MQATEDKKALRLIGLVGRNLIREKLQSAREKDTYGERLRFDGLDPAVLAACVNTITADTTCYSPALGADGLEILLPVELVDPAEIQDRSVLFNGNAAAARNTPTENRILLFANGADVEAGDTLKEIHPIREADLAEGGRAELWIEGLSDIYPALAQATPLKSQLCALFIGFRREMRRSLRITARYLLRVTDALVAGSVIGEAASEALPELRLPHFLSAMPRRQLETSKVWEKAFSIVKQIPANIFIANERPVDLSLEKLKENLELIRSEETVSEQTLEVYEALVQEIPGREWDELLRLNWLSDALCRFVSLQPATVSRKTLGLESRDFFEANANSRMDDSIAGTGISIREFLDQFAENDKLKNDEEFKRTARFFYSEIEDVDLPAKLRSKWEKLLFSAPVEGDDFITCLLRATLMLSRINRSQKKSFRHPTLLVVCQTSTQTFFTATNCRLLHFFSAMYRGLETECGEFIRFAFKNLDFKKTDGLNPLFHFEDALDALPKYKGKNKPKPCKSDKKDALQLKFFAYLVERDASVSAAALKQMPNVRLTWRLPKNCAAFGFANDLHLVANRRPAVLQNALGTIVGKNFRQTNSRGRMAEVSLKDMSSLGLNRLALVDHNTSNHNRNLKKCFGAVLASQQASSSGIDTETIEKKWDDFLGAFREALQDFEETGLAAPSIPRMHERYIELLKTTADAAPRSETFGRQALSILLSIGVFSFVEPTSAHAIVAPWNPVRLYELHRRFAAKTALIRAIAEDPENVPCQDDETLLDALEREGEQLKPSIVVVPDAGLAIDADDGDFRCSEILSATEHVSGYSLYSRVAGKNSQGTDADSVAVSELTDAARSYLELVPEAGDSLSVLLPDAEAKEFPLQAIEALAEKLPENERIIVTAGGAEGYSTKTEKKLYGGLAEGASHTELIRQESLLAPSLLSRTELRAMPTFDRGRGVGLAAGDRRYDIAFLGRFFTQTANIGWVEMPKAQVRSTNPYGFFAALQPPERRIFILGRDTTSTTLLCGGELSDTSHAYLDAARILSDSGRRAQGPDPHTFSYPCLFVDCDSGRIKAEIERLHNAARWVTTGSNLIDRRQLLKSGIKIVRYKRNADGRTCITSSSAPTSLTHRVEERIAEIAPAMTGDPAKKAADAVIEAAFRISGYVALRSARQDSNANEVLGLALSHWIAKAEALELCRKASEKPLATASFLVDDYASFFKKDKRIADLLRLTFAEQEGRLKLHLQVTEAKFRQMSTLSADKTHSAEQARATADVLYDALASASAAPLKPIWLARLSELAMSIETSDVLENSDSFAIIKLARKVREGDFDLTIDAVSHVFVHDSDHAPEYFRLDNDATGRKLSQTVIYRRDIAKLLKKGKELEFSDIDEIFADTSYAPCFSELSLTPDWKWADSLSLEFLGKPSAPVKRAEPEKEEEEDPPNDEVEPVTPAVHPQKTPPEPPLTPPVLPKRLLSAKDEPAAHANNKSATDSGAGAEPNRTETDTRPIRPQIKAEVKRSAAEGERWLPQVARAAAALVNEWDDAGLTQRLQEAVLAICETKRPLAVKAGMKELHRAIFVDSVPVNQKANVFKWLKAAGFDFSPLGEVAIDRLGFNFFEEPGFSAWKTALLAQGSVGDYGSAYSIRKCHPAADALKDFLSKKAEPPTPPASVETEPPKTEDGRWMPQVNHALVALGNEFDDDKLTQQLRAAVFAICETKNDEAVRAGMNMLYHATCAYSLSKDRKINVLKWFRDAGFDFSDAGEVELGRLGLNFFEKPDFDMWKAALLVQGTVGDYGNPHAVWRHHPAVAVLTERKSTTPPASGENESPQTRNVPRQSRISRANTRWTPQVCRAATALVNENEDDILTKRLQEAVFAICETKQPGEVKTGMEALYRAVCSDSVAYGRKVSTLEWLKAAGFDFSTTGKVKLARLGCNFFGEPDFSVWKSALLTQGSIENYGNTGSTGKCYPAVDALKDFLSKNNWTPESQALVPPSVETELEKIHDDRWVPQVCRAVVALANELDASNLTQQLRATVLDICETKDSGAVKVGMNALYRAACANSVSIDRKINILKWLRAAGFDFSDAGDVSLGRLGPNFFEDPGFRRWKMAFRNQGSIEDYGNPYAAGNRHPAAEALRGFLDKQQPTAPAMPKLETTSLVLEDHDQRAYAPDFEKLVREKGGDFSYSPEREAWAKVATQNLQTFLVAHGIPARIKRSTLTPNGCLVCFEGDEHLQTKTIEKLKEVILSTKAIKILFAEPAPGEFRILFNDGTNSRETVSLWKAWSQRSVDRTNGLNLSFLVGLKEADGQLLYLNPEKFEPHSLIAGGTGSGKTALVQTLILDMAATNPSSMLKIYLIDPKKGVDFAPIKQLPHMAEAPVTELADIPVLFEKLYKIMEERYALFSATGVNKLSTYNAKVPRDKQLPALFVIHDELAFCMQDEAYKKTVPPLMIQLATKCRAAGIYLILIAQRPDKDVVPVQVRDNLGNRLILKVPAGASEFALGEKGAEDLLGKGHMAAKMGGQDGFEYAQVPFLSDRNEVIQEVVDAIKAADKQWR